MSGKAPRDKGLRLERLAADILRSYGLDAKRVPLSGSMNGFKGDIELQLIAGMLIGEAKSRANGLIKLYQWLGENDLLIVKQDRCDPLVVMDLRRFARLIGELQSRVVYGAEALVDPVLAAKYSHKQPSESSTLPYIDPNQVPLVPKQGGS